MILLRSKPLRITLITLASLIVLTGLVFMFVRKHITLVVDGQSRSITTYALTVGSLLDSQAIALTAQDLLEPDSGTWLKQDMQVRLSRAAAVQVLADGQLHNLISSERLPLNLLAAAGVSLFPGDQLLAEGLPILADQPLPETSQPISLQVIRTIPFTLTADREMLELSSAMPGLGQALWKSGVVIQAADHLQPQSSSALQRDLQANLRRAQQLTIHTAAGDFSLLSSARTVGEALAQAGMALQGLDYSNPAPEQPIPADRTISLVRVSEEVVIEHTPLAFETAYEPDPDLELDSQSLIQAGEYGLTAHRIRVRFEDGQEVSRAAEAEWVARQPKARIVGYGTKLVKRSVNTDDGTIYYYRALTMWATSYSPASVGGSTTTASGKQLEKGLVAINYYYIPFGTMMYVPGYGFAEAADTGNLGPRSIDLGYTDDNYVAWHQYVTVYFLWPPPAQVLWIYP